MTPEHAVRLAHLLTAQQADLDAFWPAHEALARLMLTMERRAREIQQTLLAVVQAEAPPTSPPEVIEPSAPQRPWRGYQGAILHVLEETRQLMSLEDLYTALHTEHVDITPTQVRHAIANLRSVRALRIARVDGVWRYGVTATGPRLLRPASGGE